MGMAWRTDLIRIKRATKFVVLKVQDFKLLERERRRVSQEILRASELDKRTPR